MAVYANGATNGIPSQLQSSAGAEGPSLDAPMTDFEPHGEAPPPTSLPLDYRAPNSSNQPGGRPATSLPYPHPIDTRVGPTHTPNDAETVQSAMQTDSGAASANPMSGAGAGPLPASFGVPAGASGGSTLTEFTKRRNWSQRVLEELKDFLHILTPDGRILYASPSAERLTGHAPAALVGRFIVEFIHADDSATFVREFNESIASGNPLRFFYRFRTAAGAYAIFESHGHAHLSSEPGGGGTVGSAGASGPAAGGGGAGAPGYCRGFFMMARPYPTKNAGLLDSFLEHKIENERLTRRIADLKREEREEDEAQQRQFAEGGGRGGPSGSFPPETQQRRQRGVEHGADGAEPVRGQRGAARGQHHGQDGALRGRHAHRDHRDADGPALPRRRALPGPQHGGRLGRAHPGRRRHPRRRRPRRPRRLRRRRRGRGRRRCGRRGPGRRARRQAQQEAQGRRRVRVHRLRHLGLARVAQGPQRAEDAVQRVWTAVGEEGEEAHALRALAHGDRPAGAAARGREPGDERPVTLVSTIAPYIALLRELSVLAKLHHNRSRRRTSGVVRPWLGQRPTGFGAIPCLRRLGGS